MRTLGQKATVKVDTYPVVKDLASVTYGPYARVLDGPLRDEICIWTYNSDLIPLSAPGKLINSRLDKEFSSFATRVELLPIGTKINLTVEGSYNEG